jgi:hypothetical protein
MTNKFYEINFYVPETHLQRVKQAMFDAGAGKLGNYQECCWQTKGEGQFRPLPGSNPTLGEVNQLENVTEYKVEMPCIEEKLASVIKALKNSHPYEMPAYSILLNHL